MMTRLPLRHLMIVLLLVAMPMVATPAEPGSGASVYLLSMRSGFDVYLANQLTEAGSLTVVTDAALAEYILTDSVGPKFEESMETLYPKPEAEEPEPEPEDGKKAAGPGAMVEAYTKAPPRTASFSRAEGNYFLVNRHSRAVVWSTFLPHKDTRSGALNKDAGQVVKRLTKFMQRTQVAPAESGAVAN